MALPPDVADFARTHSLTAPAPLRSTTRTALFVGLYGLSWWTASRLGRPEFWLAAWLVQAALLVGGAAALHEATHGNLYRSDRANHIAGVLWALPFFAVFATYRAFHLEHHAHTGDTNDPEPRGAFSSAKQQLIAMPIIGTAFAMGLAFTTIRVLSGHPPRWVRTARQRKAIRRGALVVAAALVAALWVGLQAPFLVLSAWLVPLALAHVGLALPSLPEHYGLPGGHDATITSCSITSCRAGRWLLWNNNFHAEHHLYPAVPWHRLPELAGYLGPRVHHRRSGYLRYYSELYGSLRRTKITGVAGVGNIPNGNV
jgi:fatty acid desaturase